MPNVHKRQTVLLKACIIAVLLILLNPSAGEGQALRSLSFGTLIAGQTRHVKPSDGTSAHFRVTTLLLALGLSFVLPDNLVNQHGDRMPISFGAMDGEITSGGNAIVFNPHEASLLKLGVLTTFNIFIGATISPPVNQAPGSYTGTIVLNVLAL